MLESKQFTKLNSHYQGLALDCFKIKNVPAEESINSSEILFIILEGDYEIVKGPDSSGKVITTQENVKKLYGSLV